MNSAIAINHVSHRFGKQQVLNDITFSVTEGQIFGLLGPSGSGKTTLVKTIAGTLTPTQGEVIVEGMKMPSLKAMSNIGYMAQSDALYSELTAQENLAFFASIYGVPRKNVKKRVEQVLDTLDLLAAKNKIVEAFSGGMKRRLSLAAALLHQPKLLLLDEPTVGIDPVLRNEIWDYFARLQQQGTTILITTHVMDEAEKCDKLALMRNGSIIADGSPDQLKGDTKTDTIEQAFLVYGGAAN
ncbi:ABC transporter ATP-binding protein [Radiobacillus sp. PE A8.2]|uniref:ABC transporter ATP-binding protein n=1 Tax=Radiobacillus sp. PE A8.2 TaxID=3380349 RepID=UPI003890B7A1